MGVGVGEDESGHCSTFTRGGSTVAYLLGVGGPLYHIYWEGGPL